MPANGVETAPACLGMDPLTLFDPSDQDTAVKKRNREAQRNHRKRKQQAAAEAAKSRNTTPGKKNQEPLDTGEVINQPAIPGPEHDTGVDLMAPDFFAASDPMDFSLEDPNIALDLDQLHVQSWMDLGEVDPSCQGHRHKSSIAACTKTPPEEGSNLSIHSSPIQGMEPGHIGRFHDEPPTSTSHASRDSYIGSAASHSNHLSTGQGPPVSGFASAARGDNQPSFWGTESCRGLGWGGLDNETHSDAQGTTGVFATILEAVENAGFHSFDQMATAYYTLALEEHTPLRRTQKFSRERQLKRFLQDLSFSAEDWPEREAWVYQDVILSLAQRILSRELSSMDERNEQMEERRSSGVVGGMSGLPSEEDKLRAGLVPIIESVRSCAEHTDIKKPLVNELRKFREGAPDTWTLPSTLVGTENITQSSKYRIVVFLLSILV